MTIHDVAARAGVSTATISRVVNAQPGVGRATRCHVRRVIDELGYEPNVAARRMRGRAGRAVGVLIPDLDAAAAELLIGVATSARSRPGDLVVLCRTDAADEGWGRRVVARLGPVLIEGALVLRGTGGARGPDLVPDLSTVAVPVVVVDARAAQVGTVAGGDHRALRALGAAGLATLRAQIRRAVPDLRGSSDAPARGDRGAPLVLRGVRSDTPGGIC